MSRLDVLRKPDELQAIASEWDAALLQFENADCSLSSLWLSEWMRAFDTSSEARVVCARDSDGAIIGQAAFLLTRWKGMRTLSNMTNLYANRSWVAMRGDGGEVISRWVREQRASIMLLGRFPPSPETRSLFPNPRVRVTYDLPVISAETDFQGYLATRSGNFRRSLKRAKASHEGLDIQYTEDTSAQIEAMLEISQSTWKYEAGTAIASDSRIRDFYSGLAAADQSEGAARPFMVMVRDERGAPVAFSLGLRFGRTMFGLKMGFNPEIADRSPGFAMMSALVQNATSRDDISFLDLDAVGPAGEYKTRWATEMRSLETIFGFPNSLTGLALLGAWTARKWVRRNR